MLEHIAGVLFLAAAVLGVSAIISAIIRDSFADTFIALHPLRTRSENTAQQILAGRGGGNNGNNARVSHERLYG